MTDWRAIAQKIALSAVVVGLSATPVAFAGTAVHSQGHQTQQGQTSWNQNGGSSGSQSSQSGQSGNWHNNSNSGKWNSSGKG